MRLVIQRVNNAAVEANGDMVSEIKKGMLIFTGFNKKDDNRKFSMIADKLINIRIFEDENGKMNKNVKETNGEILLVSQFTLYGSLKRGLRPSFDESMEREKAMSLFNEFAAEMSKRIITKTGLFGDYMKINLTNDGPATFIMEF